jgi:hypothetical protein
MAGLCLLDRIHRESTDRVGHADVIDLRHDEIPSDNEMLGRACEANASGGT